MHEYKGNRVNFNSSKNQEKGNILAKKEKKHTRTENQVIEDNARIPQQKNKVKHARRVNTRCATGESSNINQQSSTEPSISTNPSPNDDNQIWNFGKPTCRCEHCNAVLWYEERLSPNKHTKKPKFGICCKQGKISLPPMKEPPQYLGNLLKGEDEDSKNFRENIRSYNSMFSFTSTGGVVDKEINKGYGPYVF